MKRSFGQKLAFYVITFGVPAMIILINLILIKELING